MADEQRLNSLDRFRKQPGRLVLEQHSHCEVPAGCGGVVLRWRNPLAGIPVVLYLYTPAASKVLIDGVEKTSTRFDLAPGRHTLALEIRDAPLDGPLLMVAARYDPKDYERAGGTGVKEKPWALLTAADVTWRFTLERPPAGWDTADFDDRDWPILGPSAMPPESAYVATRCKELGAACLRLVGVFAPSSGTVWVRKVFEVPAPKVKAE